MATKQSPLVKISMIGIVVMGVLYGMSNSTKITGFIEGLPVEGANDVTVAAPPSKTERNNPFSYKSVISATALPENIIKSDEDIQSDSAFWEKDLNKSSNNSNKLPPVFGNSSANLPPPPPTFEAGDAPDVFNPEKEYSFASLNSRISVDSISAHGAILNGQFVDVGEQVESTLYFNSGAPKQKYIYPVLSSVNMEKETVTLSSLDRKKSITIKIAE